MAWDAAIERTRILAVDHQTLVRQHYRTVLGPAEVCRIVGSALEAKALLDGGREFDIVFLDQMTPDLSGLSLLKEIRTKKLVCRHDQPVVMVCALPSREFINLCRALWVDAIIAKPFSADRLYRSLAVSDAQREVPPPDFFRTIHLPAEAEPTRSPARRGASTVLAAPRRRPTPTRSDQSARDPAARSIEAYALKPGMRLAQDIVSETGHLLIGAGVELSDRLIGRLQKMAREDKRHQIVRVVEPDSPPQEP